MEKKKKETRSEYVMKQLALTQELAGNTRLAEEFRKAHDPNELSEKAFKLYREEILELERDVRGADVTEEDDIEGDGVTLTLDVLDREGHNIEMSDDIFDEENSDE